ncbi:hypothetical protein [Novosphingobium album (ex Liu et al. 2023)]|uniref:Uncharacterized protein n=1 Tax=Novosphingobium album (ex Liu et al. 2023) TaxID=3031130 RepID=A0ABT5WUX8_9SPHN|nr:hypothetical protein [Novosphingobium album (ex Liu et al. 2023)]MDE8653683.1 hypothetical protein [Novosphingobium album (ex Liu et al. 2023)]
MPVSSLDRGRLFDGDGRMAVRHQLARAYQSRIATEAEVLREVPDEEREKFRIVPDQSGGSA